MTCEELLAHLEEYAEGRLSVEAQAQAAAHVSACATCREEAQALRALLDEAAALPKELPPPHDLWAAIEASVAGTARARRRRFTWAGLAGALAAASALFVVVRPLFAPGPPAGVQGASNETRELRAALAAEVEAAELAYAEARQASLAAMREHAAALDPETQRVINDNLLIIDGAIKDIRSQFAADPENVQLLHMLVSTQRQEINLMDKAVRIGMES